LLIPLLSATAPFIPLLLLGVALATLWLLDRLRPLPLDNHRLPTLDALRGFLAFGVFVHHACIWYYFLHTGKWEVPPSRLYAQLGQATVSLFFMITGFLFFSRLLQADSKPMDWWRLYTSRVLRIVPLWAVVMLFSAIVTQLIVELGWDTGLPVHLDSTARTLLVTAGVTWTLKYEWNFYFLLPLLALLMRQRPYGGWVAAGVFLVLLNSPKRLFDIHAFTFLGGMLAAWLAQHPQWLAFNQRRTASWLAALALLLATSAFDSSYTLWPTLLLFLAFACMANGADLFGLLRPRLFRVFGEITFSLYLLHGPVLFVLWRFVIGPHTAVTLEPWQHWGAVALATPALVAVCFVSYFWIERPFIERTSDWAKAIKSRLTTSA